MINENYLTPSHRSKMHYLIDEPAVLDRLHPKLIKLLDDMMIAYKTPITMSIMSPIDITTIRTIFLDFNTMFSNMSDTKFSSDVQTVLDHTMRIQLLIKPQGIPPNQIIINILYHNTQSMFSFIMHAIHTFCNLFPNVNYDGLVINICLDENKRDIIINSNTSIDDQVQYLRKHSMAFNVSGVTYKHKNIITVTRIEELIKLLFHELVHYVGLDENLHHSKFQNTWDILPETNLNLSETYTEFMAVLLNATYQSIHLSCLDAQPIIPLYQSILNKEISYSIRLTSNILKFYGYDATNYTEFFHNNQQKHTQPILLWEYIILRTICMIHLSELMDVVPDNFIIDVPSIKKIRDILHNDTELIHMLQKYMQQPIDSNVAYCMIDLNWNALADHYFNTRYNPSAQV